MDSSIMEIKEEKGREEDLFSMPDSGYASKPQSVVRKGVWSDMSYRQPKRSKEFKGLQRRYVMALEERLYRYAWKFYLTYLSIY